VISVGIRKIVLILLALALVAGVGYRIYNKTEQARLLEEEAAQQQSQSKGTVPSVKILTMELSPIRETLKLAGEIQAETEIAIQPRISGRLVAVLVTEGQLIRAGQIVAILDDETVRLQMLQSEAGMAVIQANLQQVELNAARAKTDKERYQELYNKRYISQRDYENAEAAYLNAEAGVVAIRAQLTAAQRNYDLLKLQLGQTKVYSPSAGIVLQQDVTVGMNLTTGSTIAVVAPLNPVKLLFNVDQKEAAKLKRGMKVRFLSDAFPEQSFTGNINEVAPAFDTKTRTLSLSVSLRNPKGELKPGIFGTAEIVIGGKDKALVVPLEAVVTREEKQGVYIIDQKKTAHFVPVTTGLSAEGQVELLTGVKAGNQVVVIGQNRLRDGQTVQLMGNGNGKRQPGGNTKQDTKPGTSPGATPSGKKAGEPR
jgi:RND family efflux transporter MFP subunit